MARHLDSKHVEQAFKRAASKDVLELPDARSGRYRDATVYFVRDGSGSERTSEGKEYSLDQIVKAFPHTKVVWFKEPPTFNPRSLANPVSNYCYVVVHVRGAEATGQFSKDGYWLLDGIAPPEFSRKLAGSTVVT
jgi:hypothetical protein